MRGPKPKPLAQRFWSKVEMGPPGDCWPWLGAVNPDTGYGQIWVRETKNVRYAHRVAWQLVWGKPKGDIRASCGNKLCMNPNHLEEIK